MNYISRAAAVALIAAALAGCSYTESFQDCAVRCADDRSCPEDLECSDENFCRLPGDVAACAAIFVAPLSCVGLAETCGPGRDEDCCSTAEPIPGGPFFRSHDIAGDGMYPSKSYPATVSSFRLDTYEVTVGRFRQFVAAGLGTQQNPPAPDASARTLNGTNQGGWNPAWNGSLAIDTAALVAAVKCEATYQTWTDSPGANENRPMVCITWYEAMAFCAWDGGFLPTEAESMYAASGGSLQRAYPWSSPAGSVTIDCTLTNYGGTSWPTTACVGAGANNVGSTSPAGDGVWGQADLGGNVWEWALDGYVSPLPMPCNDCANLFTASSRVIRGGSFAYHASLLRAANHYGSIPTARVGDVGVRCARTP